MKDQTNTKAQLIEELETLRQNASGLRQRVVELETSAIGVWQNGDKFSSSAERFRQFILYLGEHIYVTEVTDAGRRVNLYISPNV
jgi:hypothetical protein